MARKHKSAGPELSFDAPASPAAPAPAPAHAPGTLAAILQGSYCTGRNPVKFGAVEIDKQFHLNGLLWTKTDANKATPINGEEFFITPDTLVFPC